MSWLSAGLSHLFGGGGGPPSPGKFTSPMNTGPQSPTGPSGGTALPSSGFTSEQQSAFQSALSAAGIWDTVQSLGGDVWGWVKDHVGDIDWKNVGKWVLDHKKDILDAASAYNAYQRQNKADKLGQEAVDLSKQQYAEKAPLRQAGMAGMLNPQANTPDLSSLKSSIPTPMQAPLPVAPNQSNLNAAQNIAGPYSGSPFGKAAALPVAPTSPMPTTPRPGGGGGALPVAPMPTPQPRGFTPSGPSALPIAPSQPARYLINGVTQDASGKPIQGGYNELSDLYSQLGTTPGSVNPRIAAAVKANPKLIDALPVADAETLRRSLASAGY